MSNDKMDSSGTRSEVRTWSGIGVSLGVLCAIAMLALFLIKPSPPWPPPTSIASPTPPPTFTPLAPPSPTATRGPTATPTLTPSPTPIPLPTWTAVAHLTTFEYSDSVIIEERGKATIWGTDYLLLEVVGKVRVGVDMTQIEDEDVIVDGTRVQLVLPPVSVASVELFPDQTRVYVEKEGPFSSNLNDLQLQALQRAKTELEKQIMGSQSWVSLIEDLTRLQLERFLLQLGFEEVQVVFRVPGRL